VLTVILTTVRKLLVCMKLAAFWNPGKVLSGMSMSFLWIVVLGRGTGLRNGDSLGGFCCCWLCHRF
jgi:hypothetical protein